MSWTKLGVVGEAEFTPGLGWTWIW